MNPGISPSSILRAARQRRLPAVVVALLLAAWAVVSGTGSTADGAVRERCARFAQEATARTARVTGDGPPITVIGDSYAVGLGLTDPLSSWPSRLPGRVRVLGFSGSGFSTQASPCPRSAYARRAATGPISNGTVVIEGGLNDVDQPSAAVEAGLARLLEIVGGRPVLIVGPTWAPRRADAVPRIDRILGAAAARSGVPYLSLRGVRFPYLSDRLHLTLAGHRQLGDLVSRRLADLP